MSAATHHHHPSTSATAAPAAARASSNSSSSSSSSSSQPAQACAACKYQRRKCNPDCTLAPYFPADAQRQFLNAHRLFGVSNILKILRGIDPMQRPDAMRSIIYQSNMRANDPVGGCYRIVLELQSQIEREQAELALVLSQLAYYRAQAQAQAPVNPPDLALHPNLLLAPNDNAVDIYAADPHTSFVPGTPVQQQHQQYYDYFCYDGGGDVNNDENNNHSHSNSNSNSISNTNHNGLEMEVPCESAASMLSLQQHCSEDDVKPFMDMFGVKQALTLGEEDEEDSKAAAFHCSTKMELKEEPNPMERVQEHDLRGAASLFTLTNCNTSSA